MLPDAATDMTAYLNSLFADHSSNYNELKYEIQREFRHNGSPDVNSMKLDRVNYDPKLGKGSFRVVVDMSYTFSCEDVRTEKPNQTSEWTFEIDKNASVIQFHNSPYAESRSTADEF